MHGPIMLVLVQLLQRLQMPQGQAAVREGHQEGLVAGVQTDALYWESCLNQDLQQLQGAVLCKGPDLQQGMYRLLLGLLKSILMQSSGLVCAWREKTSEGAG